MSRAASAAAVKRLAFRLLPAKFDIALRRAYYPHRLRRSRPDEEPELAMIARLVGPGDSVVDIGANIGFYTYWLSRFVGPDGAVFAFEPVPPVYGFLSHNMRVLGLANVRTRCVALSDRAGEATMVVPRYAGGGDNYYMSHLADADRVEEEGAGYPVAVARLDDLLGDDAPRIAFVKCDVEGHELPCLSGAAALIERSRPALLVELSEDLHEPGTGAARLAARFAELGYRPWICRDGGLVAQTPGRRAVNTFFLQAEHAARLGAT